MNTMTLERVAYCFAKHGRITRDEPRPEELASIIADIRQLTVREAKGTLVSVPDGWKLVPVKPDRLMMDAAVAAGTQDQTGRREQALWDRMISATPAAPVAAQPRDDDAKDAARYRWLRDAAVFHEDGENPTPWVINGVNVDSFDRAPVYGPELDAVIDSILAAPKLAATQNGGAA
ncbi:MAG: hypothetical protein GAK28_00717 [Luteibacter sp.]|uniref:hypothetical protein n=1 Tax=Luteibacter sp. TaxID=1886636 RepID=UPI0013846B8E|nr:hypothetical protein [Luteibacter sp.]KAF1009084.1 MAG: hypothetical protein GAK28_00717 [Luteibacter sp.]